MKKLILAVLVSAAFVGNAYARGYAKDTLHVERISVIGNGTSSGKSLAQHTFIKRYYVEQDCIDAAAIYNAQTTIEIAGVNMPVKTIAKCEAINHSIYQ